MRVIKGNRLGIAGLYLVAGDATCVGLAHVQRCEPTCHLVKCESQLAHTLSPGSGVPLDLAFAPEPLRNTLLVGTTRMRCQLLGRVSVVTEIPFLAPR